MNQGRSVMSDRSLTRRAALLTIAILWCAGTSRAATGGAGAPAAAAPGGSSAVAPGASPTAPAAGASSTAAAPAVQHATPSTPAATHPAGAARAARPRRAGDAHAVPVPGDSVQTLKGGQEGTAFRSLTVEGEDRIHIDYQRPELTLDVDPEQAPGLASAGPAAVLERGAPDLGAPLIAGTAREPSPYLAHPWLQRFAAGAVARFVPAVQGVERWRLTIADSRGDAVASFEGHGDPPRQIAWDGRTRFGLLAVPGLTYSHVFEAWDRAGNKRSFVGQGFDVSAYRVDSAEGPILVFSGAELGTVPGTPATAVAPIVLEAAGWINHGATAERRYRIAVTARGQEQASALLGDLGRQLASVTLGNPARFERLAKLDPEAPVAGTVVIAPVR
jgi:hypothetical protein